MPPKRAPPAVPTLRVVVSDVVAGAEDIELLMGSGSAEKRGATWRLKWSVSFYGKGSDEGSLGNVARREAISVGAVRQIVVNVSCQDPRSLPSDLMENAGRTALDNFKALVAATVAAQQRAPTPTHSTGPTPATASGTLPGEFGGCVSLDLDENLTRFYFFSSLVLCPTLI